MLRQATLLIVFVALLSFCSIPCFAQANSTEYLTITTYYPSPYGVYRHLRLHPTNDFTPGAACPREGELGYDQNQHALFVCGGDPATWMAVGGGGGGGQLECTEAYRQGKSNDVTVVSGNVSAVEYLNTTYDGDFAWGLRCINGYQKTGCHAGYDGTSDDVDLWPWQNTCLSDDNEWDDDAFVSIICCRVQ